MSWILLIIQLIPTLIDIIQKIRELIRQLPRSQRMTARSDLIALAKANVHRTHGEHVLAQQADSIAGDFQLFYDQLAARVAAAKAKGGE